MIFINQAHRITLACDSCGRWYPRPFVNGEPEFIRHTDILAKMAIDAGWSEKKDVNHQQPGDRVHVCPECRKHQRLTAAGK